MKKQFLKTMGSSLIVGAFLMLAFGSDSSQSNSDDISSSIIDETHNCSVCGQKYEGNGYTAVSDSVGGKLHLQQADFNTKCMDCAQKDMTKTKETRKNTGYQAK